MEAIVPRFCVLAGLPVRLGEDGFLTDPETELGRNLAPQVTSLARAATTGHVVLLGEPGAGKTTALHQLIDLRESLVVDLELVADDEEFQERIVAPLLTDETLWRTSSSPSDEKSVEMIQAPQGTSMPAAVVVDDQNPGDADTAADHLCRTVVLDNVERCLMAPKRLATALTDLIHSVEPGRVVLFLACRTSAWPIELDTALRGALPDLSVVELAPLRRADVHAIAACRDVDPDGFMTAVTAAGATALAVVPITLELLIQIYAANQQLPAKSAALYEQGLLRLVDEPDQARRQERRRGGRDPLSPQRRIVVAERIAAWAQLCSYVGVCRDQLCPPRFLREGGLVGGVEPTPGGGIPIDAAAVADALDSSVFTGGTDQVTVRHHTIASYLGARYVVRHGLGEQQLRSLMVTSIGEAAAVYPWLRETAAWLVGLDPHAYRWLIEVDAETVATYPYAIDTAEVRQALVEHMLDVAGRDALRSSPAGNRHVARLVHPGLVQQLRPVLATGNALQREIAFQLVAAGQVEDLLEDLLRLAGDITATSHVRARAVATATRLNRSAAAPQLRTLLTADDDTPEDDLLGALLSATWPEALNVQELLAALRPESPNRLTGYSLFLMQLPDLLRDQDLPAVLDWAATAPTANPRALTPMRSDTLVRALIARTWRASNRHALLGALASVIQRCLRDDLPVEVPALASEPGSAEESDRRDLVADLVERAESREDLASLTYGFTAGALGLLRAEDLEWLLARDAATADTGAGEWRTLIRAVFIPTDPQHQLLAWQWDGTAVWDEVFAGWLAAVPLDSDHARALRAEHDRDSRRVAEQAAERDAHRRNVLATLGQLLDRAEQSDGDAFWQLCWYMQLDPNTEHGIILWGDDLTVRPGYAALPSDDQARVLPAAVPYLTIQHPHTSEWIDTANKVDYRAQAGYLAFALLSRGAPGQLAALAPAVWRTWASVLVWFDASSANTGDPGCKRQLLSLLASHASEAVVEPAVRLLKARSAAGMATHDLTFLTACWTDALGDALAAELPGLFDAEDGDNFDIVLGLLLEQNHTGALRYARDLLAPDRELTNPLTHHAARVLMVSGTEGAWPLVLAAMQAKPAWGRDMMINLTREWIHPYLPITLDDHTLARLCAWLLNEFPLDTDPDIVRSDGTRDEHARYWRDRALHQLVERGTDQAVQELQALAAEFPHYGGLRRAYLWAMEGRHHDAAGPVTLAALQALVADSRRRYIRDDAQLRALVLTALDDIQRTMQSETPQAIFLWNECRHGGSATWRPKSEPDLSDYLAGQLRLRLRDAGVVINREIEIARTSSQGIGDRVDLLVTATVSKSGDATRADRCAVVIEVKGCWNPGLLTNMDDQLARDYLSTVDTNQGIYLVGWFPRDQWDDADSRAKAVPHLDRSALWDALHEQANQLRDQLAVEIAPFILDAERRRKAARR